MGWDRPLVVTAAAWLAGRFRTRRLGEGIELGRILVVTPGRRVTRSLLEELVALGEKTGAWVSPGRMITPGQIGSSLAPPARPEAESELRAAAWGCVLRSLPKERFEQILRRRPGNDEAAEWLRIGASVDDSVGELARELLRPGDARAACDALQLPGDAAKWAAIDQAFEPAQKLIRDLGFEDRHQALLGTLASAAPLPATGLEGVVLVGVTELDGASKLALERSALPVWALVFGPETESPLLDEWGCVASDRPAIDIGSEQIEFALDYADAARRAVGRIAAWTEEHPDLTPDDLSICAPDASMVTELRLVAEKTSGLALHDAAGESVGRSAVIKLLARLQAHARERTSETLAQLVKLPVIERWLGARVDSGLSLVRRLDEAAIAAPGSVAADLTDGPGDCGKLLESLLGPGGAAPLSEQLEQVRLVLESLLEGTTLSEHDGSALRAIGETLATLSGHTALFTPLPLWRALELVLETLRTARVPVDSRRGEVEVLGWLEAAADRAPYLTVLGLNEGVVPQGRLEDSLLPEPVRRQLGMATGQSRAARDSFLLQGVVRSRAGRGGVWFGVAQHDAEGNPLRPSRFVFHCPDAEALRRVERMVSPEPEPLRFELDSGPPAPGRDSAAAFPLTPLHEVALPEKIRATAFRDYLSSPYVFFLRHVAQLSEVDEPGPEAQNNTMGTLIHGVLGAFGQSEEAGTVKEEAIAKFVLSEFERQIDAFAQRRLSTVREIQIEVARRRLRTFARLQADHASKGWRIHAAEWKPEKPVELVTSKGKVWISGQIDRIDRRGDEWLVLDYKTGDTGRDPAKTHLRNKEWIDLQLPLYALLLERTGLANANLSCGYFLLPKKSEDGDVAIAEWSPAEYEAAHEKAQAVVEGVLNRTFPHDQHPFSEGAFARLCGVWLIEKELDE